MKKKKSTPTSQRRKRTSSIVSELSAGKTARKIVEDLLLFKKDACNVVIRNRCPNSSTSVVTSAGNEDT